MLLEIFMDYAGRYGIANIYCSEMNIKICYCVSLNNCSHLTFLKKSCSQGLARWFDTKLRDSKCFLLICMKFSGIMCLVIKNICGKFCFKHAIIRKVITLAFIYVNPHPAYSIWMTHICVIPHLVCLNEWRMRQSAQKVLTQLCRECWTTNFYQCAKCSVQQGSDYWCHLMMSTIVIVGQIVGVCNTDYKKFLLWLY